MIKIIKYILPFALGWILYEMGFGGVVTYLFIVGLMIVGIPLTILIMICHSLAKIPVENKEVSKEEMSAYLAKRVKEIEAEKSLIQKKIINIESPEYISGYISRS